MSLSPARIVRASEMVSESAAPTVRPFTFDYYRHMLSTAQARGFVVSSFRDFDELNPKTVIVRHDIDYTLNGVLQIARVEAELGIAATYLFRIHANEYNLYAPYVYKLVREIQALGHEIGLHFEAHSIGIVFDEDWVTLLRKEMLMFETMFDVKIETFSEHRDFTHVIDNLGFLHEKIDLSVFGITHYAMDDRYTKQMKYLSDSNANWREGDLLVHLNNHKRFQILVHPDWWFDSHLLLKGPYTHGIGN